MSEPFADTTSPRSGPDPHASLLPMLPLIGVWEGTGKGGYPTTGDFDFGQRITFGHDGRGFLAYESRSWLIGPDGEFLRLAAREVGWWRPGGGGDDLEVVIAHATGIVEVYLGRAIGTAQWELATDVVARTQTATEVTANRRLYGIVEGSLMYAIDMAAIGHGLTPHLSARLDRRGAA